MTTPPASPDDLRAVLFDSGGVLIQPIGGRWNRRADFEQTVLAHAPSITPEQFAVAISAGDHFFAASTSTPDYDDYHRVMLHHLGVPPTSHLLADLRCEVPDDPDLVAAAVRLGYAGRALCRDSAASDVPSITSLTEFLQFF
ncbi:hypothetical protein [Streptomyces atratus]|uniref:hypothetical protein n=1 Tax=Streptomyces atratus TaxID=1893 RepID=UPI0021A287BD|nr:hypothetical protein [Streptomyces atratus]MCT2546700.1 hypothetical protein [Streptomyces atratus]